MGMRVSLTLLALAHFSMMSRDASWIGFFMYPTLISRSWALLGVRVPSDRVRTSRVAATPLVLAHTGDRPGMNVPPARRLTDRSAVRLLAAGHPGEAFAGVRGRGGMHCPGFVIPARYAIPPCVGCS